MQQNIEVEGGAEQGADDEAAEGGKGEPAVKAEPGAEGSAEEMEVDRELPEREEEGGEQQEEQEGEEGAELAPAVPARSRELWAGLLVSGGRAAHGILALVRPPAQCSAPACTHCRAFCMQHP